jgi:hypothetical protein
MVARTLEHDLAAALVANIVPAVCDVVVVLVGCLGMVVEHSDFTVTEVVDSALTWVAAVAVLAVAELAVMYVG